MSKAKQKAGAASSETIQDISHEEVKPSANGVSIIPKLVTPEEQIKLELAKFNIAESGIEQLKQAYGGLTIAGAEDKDGYKKVREAWGEVRGTRTKLEKKGLELRNGYGVITKAIKKEEDRLVELISPLEEDLYAKWKAIDEEKDRIEREKREAEEREAMARVEDVLGLGMVFRDGFYVVGESMSMDVATLRAMPVDQFEKLKAGIVAKVAEIAKVEAEKEAERQREAEQLKREKDELARQQAEMKKAQEDLQRQKEELAQAQREAAKQKLENRIGKLVSLGMKERDFDVSFDNGFSFGFSVPIENFSGISDMQFSNLLVQMEEEIKKLNIEKSNHEEQVNQEKAAKAQKENYIAECMQTAGMTYDYNSKAFKFQNEEITLAVGFDNLLKLSDAEIVESANEYGDKIVKAKFAAARAQKDREEAAAKEAEAGMSDQELWDREIYSLETRVDNIDPTYFKTKKFKTLAMQLKINLKAIINKK